MKRKRGAREMPTLPFGDDGEGLAETDRTSRLVTIEPDPQRGGYAVFDGARRRVFGTRVFETPLEAMVYLQEANRRSRWIRWKVKKTARRRRKIRGRPAGRQLKLL